MTDLDYPQSDKQEGARHPRETLKLFGQQNAEQQFLKAYNNNNLHHAWLITGHKGIGKATLAWRIAKFLFAHQENNTKSLFKTVDNHETLDLNSTNPIHKSITALSEPGLFLIRCLYDESKKQFNKNITVDQIRKLNKFFSLSSTDGTRRIVIIDSVDDLNINSANALLKSLEEPPARCTFLLISHRPSMLLNTIRSRCVELNCAQLSTKNIRDALHATGENIETLDSGLITLSSGSVGKALYFLRNDALETYKLLLEIVKTFPRLDGKMAMSLSELVSNKKNNHKIDLIIELIEVIISRLAFTGISKDFPEIIPAEKKTLIEVCYNLEQSQKWASLIGKLRSKVDYGLKVNIDPGALILNTLLEMNKTAKD